MYHAMACLTVPKLYISVSFRKSAKHSCSHYLTMLMSRGGKSQKSVAQSYTAYRIVQLELPQITITSNDTFCLLNWLNLASRRKMHKWILVFKCLNNLVTKYLAQYFIRNADLHDHATRRSNDLHPPKPKPNMSKRTFKYAGAIYFNSLPNYVKSASSVNSFKKMLTEYWFYLIISISHPLAHTFCIDLPRFFTVLQ